MAIQPAQPQSIGDVLDTSFRLYRASLGVVWPICLILVLGNLPSIGYQLSQPVVTPDPTNPMAALAMFTKPSYWLSVMLGMLMGLWAIGALYLKQSAIGTGGDMSTSEALQISLRRIPVLFVMWILYAFAVTIGLILLVIPGLILMVSLMLATNLAMIEGKGPIGALSGSHRLVWGHWWRTSAILTVGFIVLMVIYMALAFVFGLTLPFLGLNAEDVVMVTQVTTLAIAIVVNVLVMPFYTAMLIAVYWDLKLRKEGGDLAARVGALGAA